METATDRASRLALSGAWLRVQREARGLTGRALAELVGVAAPQISNYETGRTAVDDERAEGIARALGLDIIDVRRGLGLWVPDGLEPREMTPEEAVMADDSLTEAGRTLVLDVLKSLRRAKGLPL